MILSKVIAGDSIVGWPESAENTHIHLLDSTVTELFKTVIGGFSRKSEGLKERYEELVTTFVTSQETDYENGAKKEDNSMPTPFIKFCKA